MTQRYHHIRPFITFIIIAVMFAMCARPTIAQDVECGFDYLEQLHLKAPMIYHRDIDTIHTIPCVVHILHNSADPIGVGSNIPDSQVITMINDLNDRLEFNENGDTGFRYCLANFDPESNPTNGITRTTYNQQYQDGGVNVAGSVGVSDNQMKSDIGWPWEDYYNIYVVTQISYYSSGNINGYAYFPVNNYIDGTVIKYNVMNFGQTTLIHEIGHSLALWHTFEGANNCIPETDCTTQGDRVCDTNPAPVWYGCSNNCSPSYLPAPFQNYMSYSSCRDNFTEGQIDRAHAICDNSYVRQSLYSSQVCSDTAPPVEPDICDAPCPNDFCSTATDITECKDYNFCNTNCTGDTYDVLIHPAGTSICGGTYHGNGQWYTFTTTEFGYWQMDIEANFTNGSGIFGNYGEFNGIQWKLAKGDCNDLEWIAASSCPTWPPNCFCGPLGAGAWAGDCNAAPCGNPDELIPFWWTLAPVQFPTGDWLPYDPTRQEWHMTFPLPAGTYYILLAGFISYNPQNQVTYPSEGNGTISICHETPLSNAPILSHTGLKLRWEGESETPWQVYRFDGVQMAEIGQTELNEYQVSQSGYYRVKGSSGYSNYIYLEIQHINEPRQRFDILGREGAKMWIKQ